MAAEIVVNSAVSHWQKTQTGIIACHVLLNDQTTKADKLLSIELFGAEDNLCMSLAVSLTRRALALQ
jgi:hypothetical protein